MHQEFNAAAPCLCCDRVVLVRQQDWSPATAVVCSTCYGQTPFHMLRVMFTLRCQIASLGQKMFEMTQRIEGLTQAQQEMAEALADGT